MNDLEYKRLLETSWKRPLSPEEHARLHAWLSQHPEAKQSWDQEARLNQILQELPDAPVASNFTASVLQALERDQETASPRTVSWAWTGLIRAWLPRVAMASLVMALGGAFYWNDHQREQSTLAQSMRIADTLAVMPTPEALGDFEVINQLATISSAPVDFDLLAALE